MTLSKCAKTIVHCLAIIIKRETINKREQMLNGWQLLAFFVLFFPMESPSLRMLSSSHICCSCPLHNVRIAAQFMRLFDGSKTLFAETERGPNEIYAFVLFINFVYKLFCIFYPWLSSHAFVSFSWRGHWRVAADRQSCCPIRCCFIAPHCLNIIPYDRTFSFTRALTFQHSFPLCVAWLFILL